MQLPTRSASSRTARISAALALVLGLLVPAAVIAAGPPFPAPVEGQAVYDEAGALRADTEERAEATIDAIEDRTGAEIAVYTQLVPSWTSDEDAEAHAIALMDQWGVGRKGFDDGLVILYDLYENDPCHGRVQLYAGPGYQAAFLTNEERQTIFENDMIPRLRGCDLDGALLIALDRVDANATPEHAAKLQSARQLDAVLGLLVAPGLLIALVLWAVWHWVRFGRDPFYLDDPSIHIPAAPPGLTPAAGAMIRDGGPSRRALTAAMMELAARNEVAFEPEKSGLLGLGGTKITLQMGPPMPHDPVDQDRLARVHRRSMDTATEHLLTRLTSIGGATGEISPTAMLALGASVPAFDRYLEEHVVRQGWFVEAPSKARSRWWGRGLAAVIGGVLLAAVVGANLPSGGIVLVGIAAVIAGIILIVLSNVMPARTLPGAMIRAMLEAYRRTLEKTMAQARSMNQVVAESAIPLLEDPDDAVAWGVALGLQDEVQEVLERTAEDLKEGRATDNVWVPRWYGTSAALSSSGGPTWSGVAPGLMSSSAIPDFGGMLSALGTIGNSPASSGSSGGGGGSSGGGGGGAGGGF